MAVSTSNLSWIPNLIIKRASIFNLGESIPADVNVTTSGGISVPRNVLGDTTFDLSVSQSIAGNTTLFANVGLLNTYYLAYPSGAVINWTYYTSSGGDGWNSREQDAIDRDLNYQTVQGGDLYNGGNPYGRDFFTQAIGLMNGAGVTRCALGVNIASPLCPYSNSGGTPEIDWDNIDIGSVIDQITIAVNKLSAAGISVYVFEVGMELTVGVWSDLVDKTGHGTPSEGGAVVAKLITHTNNTSAVSILNHMREVSPSAFISIDSKLWDNVTNNYPNWNAQVSATAIDGLRQYYQFESADLQTYATGRARIAQYPTFFTFIKTANFNGKKTFISQIAFKAASNPVKNTFANGLLLCEIYMVLARESALNNNILFGITHMNILTMMDINNSYAPKVVYYFEKILGGLFGIDSQRVTVTINDSGVTDNCVVESYLVAGQVRIGILNPTTNTYNVTTGIAVNGINQTFSSTQIYSPALNILDTNYTIITAQNTLNLRPYSFTVIVVNNS